MNSTLVGVTKRTTDLRSVFSLSTVTYYELSFPHFITVHVTVCVAVQETTMHLLMTVPYTQNGDYTFVKTVPLHCSRSDCVEHGTWCHLLQAATTLLNATLPPASWGPFKDDVGVDNHSPRP